MNFIPYGKQDISDDDINSVIEVLKSDFLTTGPKIKEFESVICEYTKAKYCVSVSNGTAALHLSSLALLKEGDKVLTTPNSFLATSNSILYAKAKPIFVDINEDANIDLDLCEEYLKKDVSIKAIYVVSFSGNLVNQEKLGNLKEKYNIKILEDNAHSIGATQFNIRAGSCENSDISIFSFHPVKNMTTAEGGAITTNSETLYKKLIALRNHGMVKTPDMKPWEYEMRELGFNYRITDIQCALGLSQIEKLDLFINRRRSIAKRYDEAFTNSEIRPLYAYSNESAYHLYVVRVDFRKLDISKKELFLEMKEKNIGLQVHYIPINKQVFYKELGLEEMDTPIMDKYYEEAFSIPIYPTLTDKEQEYVINNLMEFVNV